MTKVRFTIRKEWKEEVDDYVLRFEAVESTAVFRKGIEKVVEDLEALDHDEVEELNEWIELNFKGWCVDRFFVSGDYNIIIELTDICDNKG
jgi:hypothetical protein